MGWGEEERGVHDTEGRVWGRGVRNEEDEVRMREIGFVIAMRSVGNDRGELRWGRR